LVKELRFNYKRCQTTLEGMKVHPLKRTSDERGSFTEIIREDWKDPLQEDRFVQANLSTSYPGIIRAWHRHLRNQTDYFIVLKGALKICAYDEETRELTEIVSTSQEPKIVRIPGHYWHGFKTVGDETAFLLYFTTMLYDHKSPDEERKPWNDLSVKPETINGRANDPRAGKPWDWNYPPHK
jgi:dTDP-4-dehydrorhamnose 3,5-epimerase